MEKRTLLLSTLVFLFCASLLTLHGESAGEGIFRISPEDLGPRRTIPLQGEWDFFWNQFVQPGGTGGDTLMTVPGNWASGGAYPAEGFATYQLTLHGLREGEIYALYIPEMISSFRFFVDGREVAANGTPGRSEEDTMPQFLPGTAQFAARGETGVITVWVSNFNYRKSGIWRNIHLGTPGAIQRMRQNRMLLDIFLIGILVFVSLYHISLYFFRREEKAEFFFGLICLVMAIRIVSTGEQMLGYALPGIPWEAVRRLEFSPFSLAAALTPLFLRSLFPREADKPIIGLLLGGSAMMAVIFFLLPVKVSNHFMVYAEMFMVIVLVYSISIILRAIRKRRIGALLILTAVGILFLTVLNDVLYSNQVIRTFYMSQIGFILFIIIQALMLSRRYAHSFRMIENLTLSLKEFNDSLSRFVPFQFLEHLKKESILEVKLGDQVHEEMTILFADIRSFTTLSEDMTPEENFRFLNSFLSNVVPVIRQEGGFVDKFIGDGIMALFPTSPCHALKAAVCLQEAVVQYNLNRDKAGYRNIRLGVGIHTGSIMLGTIGEHDRMETTVIADTVNVASRMEQLTKLFGASIIITRQMYQVLEDLSEYEIRNLGLVNVKGKRDKMEVLEVLNGLHGEERNLKMHTREVFEQAVRQFREGRYDQAMTGFHRVLAENPADKGAAYYIDKCRDVPGCSD